MSQPQPPTPARRGLGALIQSTIGPRAPITATSMTAPLSAIRANPDQPRKTFREQELQELADSIKAKGILQPIIVRPLRQDEIQGEAKYEIIAGERRWRASQRVGLSEVPVIVKDVASASDGLLLSLVENLQRDDLNPIEEAEAYKRLQQVFTLTQDQIAAAVGKSRGVVANSMRLLDLPSTVVEQIRQGALSPGHAKVLLSLGDPKLQSKLAGVTVSQGLTVRQLETYSMDKPGGQAVTSRGYNTRPKRVVPAHIEAIENKLRAHFGTKVHVKEGTKRGKIVVEFYSVEDFDRITSLMGLTKI